MMQPTSVSRFALRSKARKATTAGPRRQLVRLQRQVPAVSPVAQAASAQDALLAQPSTIVHDGVAPVVEVCHGENNIVPAASLHTSSSSQAEASQQLTEHQDAESLDDGSVLALVRLAHQMATEQEAWQKEVLDSETVYEQQQRRALEVASKRQELVRKALVQLSELHMVAKRAAKEQELRSLKWTVLKPGEKPQLRTVAFSVEEVMACAEAAAELEEMNTRVTEYVQRVAQMIQKPSVSPKGAIASA